MCFLCYYKLNNSCYEKGLLFNQKHILVQFSWRLSSCAGRKMGSNTVKTVESEPWKIIVIIAERHVRNQNKDSAAKKKNFFLSSFGRRLPT